MDIKAISLPLPSNEYDSIDQQVTRRITEQAIETISSRLNSIEKLDSNQLSNAIRKKQFLLMGATEQASKLTTTAEIADGAVTSAKLDTNITVSGTLDSTGKLTADAGIDIDNFNIDGTTIALSSGDMLLDSAGNIILDADGGEVAFKDGGTAFLEIANSSSDAIIRPTVQDKDLLFNGNDGGGAITALRLDMSAGGDATFNGNIILSGTSRVRFDHSIIGDDLFDTDSLGLACDHTESIRFGIENADGSFTEKMNMSNSGNLLLKNAGNEVYMDIFSDSGTDRGAGYFRFLTDGALAQESVAQIYMEQGSGDGGSRKCNMYFQVSDNGAPSTALSIANNKHVTADSTFQATGGVYISAFDGDKLITDASQGGGSDALYIGNAQIQVSSDERIKKDVVNTAINATEKLKKVRVVDFTWDDPTDQSYNNKNVRGKWTGAIAQELISVFPHIINAPRDKDTLEVDNDSERKWLVEYQNLVPVLIKAIQELSAKNDALEARIKTLEDA